MKQRGFTLIEILIAMAIFTLIGLASTGLLTTVIDSNDLSSERFEKLQQLQRAMVIIERDIQQAVPRPVRAEGETLQYVAYRLDEDRLERVYSNYVDNVIGYEPKTRTLLENIESFTVEFISAESSSDDDDLSWSESYQGEVLPMAVAIEFVSKDFGLIRREFALTAGSA